MTENESVQDAKQPFEEPLLGQDEPILAEPLDDQEYLVNTHSLPAKTRKKGNSLNNGLLAALIALLLVLCLIAGGAGWYINNQDLAVQSANQQVTALQATATQQQSQLSSAQSAIDVLKAIDIQATADAAVSAALAAEAARIAAIPTATAVVIVPAGEEPVDLASAQAWSVVLQDAFDNNDNLWGKDNGYLSAKPDQSKLLLFMDCINLEGACQSYAFSNKQPVLRNFLLTYTLDLSTLPGGWSHLLGIRSVSPFSYVFSLGREGKFDLSKTLGAETISLASSAITDFSADTPHTIDVLAQGDLIRIFLDGNQIVEVRDADIPAGLVRPGILSPTVGNASIRIDDFTLRVPPQ
ncbi:MAG TPA: hypothetical protein PK299_05845 [Anaerolineales bacterium]|nr:hypothetical protein [Anaerolineales bacterium]